LESDFSEMCRHVIPFFKVRKGHIGVIPHHHTTTGTKGEVQGRYRRSVEVDGGDFSGGESEGESWRHLFLYLPFLGFPLTTS